MIMKYSLSNIWQMALPTYHFHSQEEHKVLDGYSPITTIKTKSNDGKVQIQKMEYDHRGLLNMSTDSLHRYHYKNNDENKCAETLIFQSKYLIGRHSYIYDNDQRLIKIFEFGGRNQKLKHLHTFEYDLQNRLTGHHIFSAYLNDYFSRSFFQWTDGNISSKLSFNHKKEKTKTNYCFDDIINPNLQHPLYIKSTQGWNKNNVIQKKKTIWTESTGTKHHTIDFKINYNKLGLIKDVYRSDGQIVTYQYGRSFSIL